MRNNYLVLFVFFVLFKCSYSQEVIIKGNVVDFNNKGVSFVNIFTNDFEIATITDSIGNYKIIIPSNIKDNDTIFFSCIGFEQLAIKVLNLKNTKKVLLSEKTYELAEIDIRDDNWYKYIDNALTNYKNIYYKKNHLVYDLLFELNEYQNNENIGSVTLKANCYADKINITDLFLGYKFKDVSININKTKFLSNFPSILYPGYFPPKIKANYEIILDSIYLKNNDVLYCFRYYEQDKKTANKTIYNIHINLKSNNIHYYSVIFINTNKKLQYGNSGYSKTESFVYFKKYGELMYPQNVTQKLTLIKKVSEKVEEIGEQIINIEYSNIKESEKNVKKDYNVKGDKLFNLFLDEYNKNNCEGQW